VIVCFFRNEQNQSQKLLLGMPQASRYFGSTIAFEVLNVLKAYGIQDKIGYFTLDNAESNTIAMKVVGGELGFDGRRRRDRCTDHTINLAAKALLFGKHPDVFERQLDGQLLMTIIEYQHWRAKGPVGKLHNLMVDVCNVHQLFTLFERVQQRDRTQKRSLQLILDTNIRWLSQLYMIWRALLLKTFIRMLLIKA
jgi:hypothetical protein